MPIYDISLYRSRNYKRGWLAYLRRANDATLVVWIEAENGQKAKNQAITTANQCLKNRDFQALKIIDMNHTDKLWGINNFPELESHFPMF